MTVLATLVDVSALWHVAVFAFAATLAVVGAYGVGVLALGFWAMTQK